MALKSTIWNQYYLPFIHKASHKVKKHLKFQDLTGFRPSFTLILTLLVILVEKIVNIQNCDFSCILRKS